MIINTTTVLEKVNTTVVCTDNTFVLCFDYMKLNYGQRLRSARKQKGWTQGDLERESGVKQGSISKIERGDQDSSAHDIELATALDINPVWLKNGDSKYAPAWLLVPQDGISELAKTLDESLRRVPIVGNAQLGDNGYWCDMNYPEGAGDGYIKFPTEDEDAYAVRCVGDSMRPRIKHGEFVIIEPHSRIMPGEEVLIKAIDGRVMIKTYLYERDGHIYFQSINENHPSISILKEDIDAMHYVAAVIKSSRWIKY